MIVYRGSDHSGMGKFYSTSRDFAADYGKPKHYNLNTTKILNTTTEKFYDHFVLPNRLIDPYTGEVPTRLEWGQDTWETIEDNLSLFDNLGYDALLITEGGVENYLVLNPKAISEILTESEQDLLSELKREYQRVNQAHYEGKLPDIPFAWGSPKGALAAVLYSVTGKAYKEKTYLPNSMQMVFTNQYKMSLDQLIPLLLHEIVHVYIIAVLGDVKESHGLIFRRELARLRVLTGVEIPITETAKDLDLAQDAKPIGLLIRYVGDKKAYALFSPKIVRERKAEFEGKWRDRYELRIVTSDYWYRKSLSVPLQRNINYKTRFWIMDEAGYQDLLDNSVIV